MSKCCSKYSQDGVILNYPTVRENPNSTMKLSHVITSWVFPSASIQLICSDGLGSSSREVSCMSLSLLRHISTPASIFSTATKALSSAQPQHRMNVYRSEMTEMLPSNSLLYCSINLLMSFPQTFPIETLINVYICTFRYCL